VFLPPLGGVDNQTIGVCLEMIWQIDKTRLERIFQTKAAADWSWQTPRKLTLPSGGFWPDSAC